MNKNDLIARVAEAANISKASASKAVDGFFDAVTDSLRRGEEVRLVGFGSFYVSERKATEGRNPRTREKIQIAAARLPKFRSGKTLKENIS
jgi:DNA-binding protein HU-beta